MNLWERFSRIIYRTVATPFLKQYRKKSIESVLQKSTTIINAEIQGEIKQLLLKSFTKDGGFADRGGKTDIYYTLFGCFVAEALTIEEVFPQLKIYVKKNVEEAPLNGINLFSAAILYAKLFGVDTNTLRLRKLVRTELEKANNQEYSNFIGLLTLYYLEDYRNLLKLRKRITVDNYNEVPCSIAAAEAVIDEIFVIPKVSPFKSFLRTEFTSSPKAKQELERSGNRRSQSRSLSFMDSRLRGNVKNHNCFLLSFYRGNGGFAALKKAPIEDLLSTAVALYALRFVDADLKEIKPDCLTFVDGLYLNGGFRATELDFDIDIEYTFYGLLALGALAD